MYVGYGNPNDLKYLAKNTTIDPEVEQKFLSPKDPRWPYSSQKVKKFHLSKLFNI
jgi:hypothetical protein